MGDDFIQISCNCTLIAQLLAVSFTIPPLNNIHFQMRDILLYILCMYSASLVHLHKWS